MRRMKSNAGFTIVEVLAVAIILVTTGAILTGIISSLLRGSTKTKTTNAMAQNGNYTISIITDILNTSAKVTKVDNNSNIINFCTSTPPKATSITLKRLDGLETTLICDLNNKKISSISADLSSVNLINSSEVEIDTSGTDPCFFKCTQPNNDIYSPPLIEVDFNLKSKKAGLSEFQSSGSFNTSVLLRNYTSN